MQNTMTRREFVKMAGIVGGSVLLGTSFLNSALAAPRPLVQGFFSTQKLYNGVEIPLYGLDACKEVFVKAGNDNGTELLVEALNLGYKNIEAHGATSEVGNAFVLSQIPRQDVFLSLHLPQGIRTDDEVVAAFNDELARMKTDYLDLVLVEIPEDKGRVTWLESATEVWTALESLYKQGRVRAIGVVNLQPEQLDVFLAECEIKPMINQLNISPFTLNHKNKTFIEKLQNRKIAVSTDMPLGDFEGSEYDPVLLKIGKKYNKTGAQVALRWNLQMGHITMPTAGTIEQVKEYADVFSFALNVSDMSIISRLQEKKSKKK